MKWSACACGVLVIAVLGVADDSDRRKTPITLQQLSGDYEIIGALGVPLGQVVTIDSTVVIGPQFKGESKSLVVHAVNGRPLDQPLTFDIPYHPIPSAFRPQDGNRCRLRVYESGGFRRIPAAAASEMDPPHPSIQENRPARDPGFGFGTQLFLVRVIKPDPASVAEPAKGR